MGDIAIADWAKLGSAIRDARSRKQLSQQDLARQAGVSRSWLAKVEAGHRGAELEQILRLLNALDMSLALRQRHTDDGKQRPETDHPSQGGPGREASRAATKALLAAHESAAARRRGSWELASAEPTARPREGELAGKSAPGTR